jgi:hypothetical protein
LELDCDIDDDAIPTLTRFKRLKHLLLPRFFDVECLKDVLSVIGGSLLSLGLLSVSKDISDAILSNCPCLEWVEFADLNGDKKTQDFAEMALKKGLKRLTKLKVKGVSVRVGTDWGGY